MSGYYSTQGSLGVLGSFGISNTIRVGVQGTVNNFTSSTNNFGMLPPNAGTITSTNVVAGLLNNLNPSVEQRFNAGQTNKTANVNEYNANRLNVNVGPTIGVYPNGENTYQN